MSSALVKKSLLLCDADQKGKKLKKSKLKGIVTKINKNTTLKSAKKVTVQEAIKLQKVREETFRENLERLREAKKANVVRLDEEITSTIIERAVPRWYMKQETVDTTKEGTLFTEEDFKKFEEEYIVE